MKLCDVTQHLIILHFFKFLIESRSWKTKRNSKDESTDKRISRFSDKKVIFVLDEPNDRPALACC